MWPRDLLPEDAKQARIMTFGYDADVWNFFSATSHSGIIHHALNLLQDLRRERLTAAEVCTVLDDVRAVVVGCGEALRRRLTLRYYQLRRNNGQSSLSVTVWVGW
jgi:hypothetical protein